MAEPPDLHDLAKRYLDLWQDQLRAMAADPDTMAAVGRMLASAAGHAGQTGQPDGAARADGLPNPFALWPMAGLAPGLTPFGGATPFDSVFTAGRAAAQAGAETGSQAAAGAPDGGGDELRKLERRLAALEERLAALEPGAGRGSRSGKAKPRKGKR